MEKQSEKERRQSRRYKANPGAFAAISDTSMAGQIINISQGGLSFKYMNEDIENSSGGPPEMALALVGNKRFINQLDFKIIRDYPVLSMSPFSSLEFRRCHLQFIEIDALKQAELEDYIQGNTTPA